MNNFGITGQNKKNPEGIIRSLKHNVLKPTCNRYKFDAFNLAVKLAFVSVCTIAIYRIVESLVRRKCGELIDQPIGYQLSWMVLVWQITDDSANSPNFPTIR